MLIGLIIGLYVGAFIGIIIIAACSVSASADRGDNDDKR